MHSDTAVRGALYHPYRVLLCEIDADTKNAPRAGAIVSKFNVVPNMRGNMARQAKVEDGAWYLETYFPVDHVYLIPRGPAETVV